MRRLRIEPEVKFVSWGIYELRVIGPRIEAGAHKHQLLGQTRKCWIDRNSQCEVGHRTALVDGDLVGKFMDHPDEKMGGVLIGWPGRGFAFGQLTQLIGRMIKPRSPGSQPGYAAILLLPALRILFCPYQRELRSWHDRYVGWPDEFKHAQGVRQFVVEPLVARHHRNT